MNKLRIVSNTFFAILCFAFINKASYSEPANLSLLKAELVQYHDSGLYQKELTKVITNACQYIIQRAQANNKKPHKEKLAIVLDIDETSLSSYDYIVKHDFAFNKEAWHQHMLKADATAIKPMLTLYKHALHNHVAVFFVTGRANSELKATEKNLTRAGFIHWSGLYTRPKHGNEPSVVPFKAGVRAKITKLGYVVIASIGDQISDGQGGYAEKTFKLPNPYYFIP